MSGNTSNLREGGLARSSHWILGAFVSVLAMSGVVVVPAMKVGSVEELLSAAEGRAQLFESTQQELAQLESSGAIQETRQALVLLADYLPEAPREIEVHSAARLGARSVGMQLDTIGIGEAVATGWPVLDQEIYAHVLSLAGESPLAGLAKFRQTLNELGYPCSIAECSFSRDTSKSKTFKFRMVMHLYHAAERQTSNLAEEFEDHEEMP